MAVQSSSFPIIYKYAVATSEGQLDLEAGENRLIGRPEPEEAVGQSLLLVQQDGHFRC